MMDFDNGDKQPEAQSAPAVARKDEAGKNVAGMFAAVRDRGMLNASLDVLAQAYEKSHPDMRCRWETYRPNSDLGTDNVMARQAQGFKLVDASELVGTPAAETTGLVRRGDLVLMAGSQSMVDMLSAQDAEAASQDARLAKDAYVEGLSSKKVRRTDGEIDEARPTGTIKITEEVVAGETSH